jgi:hypothetical protein
MTQPTYYSLPEKCFTESFVANGYRVRRVRTINETIRHALREYNLTYKTKWEAVMIFNDEDEANLAMFKLKHL